ncbi:MAG: UDP-N-acetylglucosamine 2-epimerase [Hyphomicrobiales bacterium]
MKQRNILFLTGTRADFGKLKPLMEAVEDDPRFCNHIFCTGMHQLKLYGLTAEEVTKERHSSVHHFLNQYLGEPMEMILANTIAGLSRYLAENRPDMIVVHGDRVETLAGAIVGVMKNILVAHIEGGERSGTVDEMIRHAVSKLSHLHFVANKEAAARLEQMGEDESRIFVIGSPDIDVMVSDKLPTIEEVKVHYEIPFENYSILMFHPVTTENEHMDEYANQLVDALLEADGHYVVIYPNNDEGTHYILNAYKRLEENKRFVIYPSIQFERFLTLLKNAESCIGNSSAGMREAPFYAIPTINIGTRQRDRFKYASIINCGYEKRDILESLRKSRSLNIVRPSAHFGSGDSRRGFLDVISGELCWKIGAQKQFCDLPLCDLSSMAKQSRKHVA